MGKDTVMVHERLAIVGVGKSWYTLDEMNVTRGEIAADLGRYWCSAFGQRRWVCRARC